MKSSMMLKTNHQDPFFMMDPSTTMSVDNDRILDNYHRSLTKNESFDLDFFDYSDSQLENIIFNGNSCGDLVDSSSLFFNDWNDILTANDSKFHFESEELISEPIKHNDIEYIEWNSGDCFENEPSSTSLVHEVANYEEVCSVEITDKSLENQENSCFGSKEMDISIHQPVLSNNEIDLEIDFCSDNMIDASPLEISDSKTFFDEETTCINESSDSESSFHSFNTQSSLESLKLRNAKLILKAKFKKNKKSRRVRRVLDERIKVQNKVAAMKYRNKKREEKVTLDQQLKIEKEKNSKLIMKQEELSVQIKVIKDLLSKYLSSKQSSKFSG